MTTLMRPENIDLPRGTSETFTDEPRTSIKVPSCRPTPLIGSWADESWPLNSRQASEIIVEQVLQRQKSSTIFDDDSTSTTNLMTQGDYPSSSVDDCDTISESMMNEAMSHAQISTEEVVDSPVHVAQCYFNDPYNMHVSRVTVSRCTCDDCVAMLSAAACGGLVIESEVERELHENDSVSNQVSPAPVDASPHRDGQQNNFSFMDAPPEGMFPTCDAEEEGDWDLPTYGRDIPAAPAAHQFPGNPSSNYPSAGGFMTHTQISSPPFMEQVTPTASPGHMNATPSSTISGFSHPPPTQRRVITEVEKPEPEAREVSTFMPPPPPPRISTLVYEEEGTIKNPSGLYYHLVMRWYSKILESQLYFITPETLCPAPNKDKYSFEQWADEISGWWYTNFEHMQKKAVTRFPRRR